MSKNILICGLIAGMIIALQMVLMVQICIYRNNSEPSMVVGFGSMIVAFSLVFIGIRHYRNQSNKGMITFGKAFQIGALIALVAATTYVIIWFLSYHFLMPDFIEKYTQMVLNQAAKNGATAAEIAAKNREMKEFGTNYKNPFFIILATYLEALPLGLLIALISALILKRK